MTAHKAQGATVERAWVLGSDACYREWAYVAPSRARAGTRLYLVGDANRADDGFAATLERSAVQDLATDTGYPAGLPDREATLTFVRWPRASDALPPTARL